MTEYHWLLLDRFTIVIAALAALLSGMAWVKSRRLISLNRREQEKRKTPIQIRLVDGQRTFDLPYRPRRDQLSRQELTGLLSFYYGEQRFEPAIARRVLDSGALSQVLAGNAGDPDVDNVLRVEVDQPFFDQVVKNVLTGHTGTPTKRLNEESRTVEIAVRGGHASGKVWNLTPHAIHYDDGNVQRTIQSDGSLRLEQQSTADEPIAGMQVVRTCYGKPGGLPDEIAAGDVLIVSTLVSDCWNAKDRPEGVTVIVPDTGETCKRDSTGRIVSVSRFILK